MVEKVADDGAVTISEITWDGSLKNKLEVSCQEFIDKYRLAKGYQMPSFVDYEKDGPIGNDQWLVHEHKAKVILAVGMICKSVGHVDVRCRIKPSKSVFALRKFKVGECVIVPTTDSIKAKPTKDVDAVFSCVGDAPSGCALELGSAGGNKDVVHPAWYMTSTIEQTNANMKISMVKVDLSVGPKRTVAKSSASVKTATESSTVAVPIFVNAKVLNEGDELIYHKPENMFKQAGIKRPFDLI